MPKFVNTFSEGLDKDTVPTNYKNTKYYDARNFNIVVAEDLSSATLTNNKGIEHIIKYDNGSTTKKIVGIAETSTTIVLFIQTNTTISEIHEISKTAIEEASSIIDLNLGTYLVVSKAFDFGDRVEVVAREETPLIKKIYWVDGVNPIRFCNLATDKTELAGYSITQFEIIQEITFSNPIYSKLISGSLTAGVYQYAYCLYNQNAGQSAYSPLSQFIQITETGLTTDSALFSGSAIGVATTSGIEITINDSNTNFDYIRVVALFYSSPDSIPEITIIYEGNKTSNITIAHTGTQNLGSLSLEEAIASPIILIPKTISSKYNYLFVGNSQEQVFDVDFDARAYRFNSDGQGKLFDASTKTIRWDVSTDGYNVLENYDCANLFNYVEDDETRDSFDNCKYKSNGTLGGEGLHVNYGFKTHLVALATTPYTDMEIWKTTDGYTNGLGGYANPYENNYVGYQRDEIYRFGIVFFNSKGQSSFVKWIGDIRMPKASEYTMIDGVSGTMYGKALGLNFVFNFTTLLEKYPDIVSYRIVRTKRNYTDSTVVDTGYIGHLYKDKNTLYWQGYSKGSLNYPGLHSTVAASYSVKNIVEYICAETNYNKNNYSNYNRLDIYDGGISSKAKKDSTNTYDYDNIVLTKLIPSSTFNTYRDIEDATLFRAQRSMTAVQNLSSNFDGFSVATRSHVNASGSRGYKGTTLLLKLDSDITGVTDNTCPYVLRRQYIQPYGGYSNSAITNSTYYPCSPIYDITTTDIDVFGGDTYISIFEYNRTLWADGTGSSWDRDRYAQIIQCIVESKINLNYTVNHRWSYYDDGSFSTNVVDDNLNNLTYSAMWETSGTWEFYLNDSTPRYFVQDFNLYTYNPVYSLSTGSKNYISKPINFTENTSYTTRVYVSEKKINGEVLDSWTQFLINNYTDLDNQFGDLTRLFNNNNTLFYFQEKGFGVLPIAEREVVSTNNGSSVGIGTGGVLERFDYITTGTGTTLPESIVGTDSNIYWVDSQLNKIGKYGSNGFSYISDINGLFSYMNTKDLSTCSAFYNPLNKELYFSFSDESIIYNEYTNSFISLTDTIFDFGVNFLGKSYLFKNFTDGNMYFSAGSLYNNDYGLYSIDYKSSTLHDSVLDLIINPAKQLVTIFDILELSTEVFDSGVNQVDETFTSLRVRNNYQDTGTITLTAGNNIIRRFRTWRFNGLRNSLDSGRIIDNYGRLTLTFANTNNMKLVVNDIQSSIRPLNIK